MPTAPSARSSSPVPGRPLARRLAGALGGSVPSSGNASAMTTRHGPARRTPEAVPGPRVCPRHSGRSSGATSTPGGGRSTNSGGPAVLAPPLPGARSGLRRCPSGRGRRLSVTPGYRIANCAALSEPRLSRRWHVSVSPAGRGSRRRSCGSPISPPAGSLETRSRWSTKSKTRYDEAFMPTPALCQPFPHLGVLARRAARSVS